MPGYSKWSDVKAKMKSVRSDIAPGATEAAYRKWIDLQGDRETDYQEYRAQEVLRFAQKLDEYMHAESGKRAVLMASLRAASQEFIESMRAWKTLKAEENQ
jgi:hypothetical protein